MCRKVPSVSREVSISVNGYLSDTCRMIVEKGSLFGDIRDGRARWAADTAVVHNGPRDSLRVAAGTACPSDGRQLRGCTTARATGSGRPSAVGQTRDANDGSPVGAAARCWTTADRVDLEQELWDPADYYSNIAILPRVAGLSPYAHWVLEMSKNPKLALDLTQLESAELLFDGYVVNGLS